MAKFWVIFKREYAQVVRKKAFLVGILLTPVLMLVMVGLPALLVGRKSSTTEYLAIVDQSQYQVGEKLAERLSDYKLDDDSTAYYDVAVIAVDPAESGRLSALQDSLGQAILDESLKYYLVIGPDALLADSAAYLVSNVESFRSRDRFEGCLRDIFSALRLKESNINLSVDSVLNLTRAMDLQQRDVKGEAMACENKYFGNLVFIMIMFAMIFGYGQLVMRSVIEEKNSRIMEVLVSSVSPFQLMMGKVLGLGAAAFTQVGVWFLIGAGLYGMKTTLAVDPNIDRLLFNPAIITFFVLFMISGYLLFSSLFALIGSIVNSEKEAQNFVVPISITLIIPVILGVYVVQEPNSALSTGLSLIPLLTPTMMMMRVIFVAPSLTEYSLFSGLIGQASLGFVLVCLSVWGMVWLTSRVFRIGILMYGKRPTLPEVLRWVRH